MVKVTKYDEKLTFCDMFVWPPHRRLKTMAATANGPRDVTACLRLFTNNYQVQDLARRRNRRFSDMNVRIFQADDEKTPKLNADPVTSHGVCVFLPISIW